MAALAPLVLSEHTDHIYDLAWSATGDRLAAASYDRTVGLWNTAQLAQQQVTFVARLHGHDDQVQTVAFHPNGTVLVSGGKDQTPDGQGVLSGGLNGVLRLYGLNGSLRVDLVGHTGEIKAVAVSADGRWALSGANDQTLCLWPLPQVMPTRSSELKPTLTLFPAQEGEWVA
jgi:WD40 repeat protein